MSTRKRDSIWRVTLKREWIEADFRKLSMEARGLYYFYRIGSGSTIVPGLSSLGGPAGTAEMADMPQENFDRCHRELESGGWVAVDWGARLIWLPREATRDYQVPDNANQATAWRRQIAEFPACALKTAAVAALDVLVRKNPAEGVLKAWIQVDPTVESTVGTIQKTGDRMQDAGVRGQDSGPRGERRTTSADAEAVGTSSHRGATSKAPQPEGQDTASPRSKVVQFRDNPEFAARRMDSELGRFFQVWWEKYPKRASKSDVTDPQSRPYLEAWAEWKQINPDITVATALLKAAQGLDDSEIYKFDGTTVLTPAEFLRCWSDAKSTGVDLEDVIFRMVEAA